MKKMKKVRSLNAKKAMEVSAKSSKVRQNKILINDQPIIELNHSAIYIVVFPKIVTEIPSARVCR